MDVVDAQRRETHVTLSDVQLGGNFDPALFEQLSPPAARKGDAANGCAAPVTAQCNRVRKSLLFAAKSGEWFFPTMRSPRVVKPLIGISCCTKQFGVFGMPNHAASDTYVKATDEVIGGVPVLLPANGPMADVETLLERLDGIILTGSRSNVQPTLYDGPPHAEGTCEDPARDGITLPLIRAAVMRGVPLLAICRGFQELNVALGGSLHQRLQDLPDRFDHSTPMQPSAEVRQAKAHSVRIHAGRLAAQAGRRDGDGGELAAQPGHR